VDWICLDSIGTSNWLLAPSW